MKPPPLEDRDLRLEAALDAERSVLGATLSDPEAALTVPRLLTADDFHLPQHRLIFQAVSRLAQRGTVPDLLTLHAELAARGQWDDLAQLAANLTGEGCANANLETHCRLVRQDAKRRRAMTLAGQIAADPAQANGKLDELRSALAPEADDSWASRAISAPALAAASLPDPVSIIGQGLLARGDLGVLYGQPKVGKSWLLCMLALAIARGEPWLGLAGPKAPMRVGFVSLEVTAKNMQQRLKAIGGSDQPEGLYLLTRSELGPVIDLLDRDTHARLIGMVRALELDLLMLDPLNRLHKADPNDSQAAAGLMAAIHEVGHQTGVGQLISAHERKRAPGAKDDDDISALANSGRFTSDPNLLLRVQRHGGLLKVKCVGANNGQPFEPIFVKPSRGDGPAVVVPDPTQTAETNRHGIEEWAEGREVVSADECAAAVGLSLATAQRHLRALGFEPSRPRRGCPVHWSRAGLRSDALRSEANPYESEDLL